MSPKKKIPSEEKCKLILDVLEDKKAVDPVSINVQERTLMTDYIIVASGTSRIHIRSLVDAILETMKDTGIKKKRIEGYEESQWVLMDYDDVVVHVMSPEHRELYRLESYWSGAEKGSPRLPMMTE